MRRVGVRPVWRRASPSLIVLALSACLGIGLRLVFVVARRQFCMDIYLLGVFFVRSLARSLGRPLTLPPHSNRSAVGTTVVTNFFLRLVCLSGWGGLPRATNDGNERY